MRHLSLAVTAGLLLSGSVAMAGTKVQGNIVPDTAGVNPLVSEKSKFKMAGSGDYQVGLKGITDGGGAPAPVTNGLTPDTQYWIVIKGDSAGVQWQYNVPFNIEKAGQAKIKGSVGLISTVPVGSAVGIQGVEIHGPALVGSSADCTTIMNSIALPGVFIPNAPFPTNPCASGPRIGVSGILTE